ncbi:hypothetical protein [Nocardia sp. CA-120079]|uniref:hypothetical protein n=1 Tax=Nocardia sp. CA-120079 TaxID=3239974 RepID=UPI003D963FEA
MNNSLIGVGLFEITLDDGRLPVQVDVNRNLHSHLDARDFSTAAMTGYYKALWIRDADIIATGNFSALSARPSRRAEIITLLDTQSLAEFEMIERAARGHTEFIGTAATTSFGMPSVTVTANLSRVLGISIDARWAASTQPSYIAYDIVECANRIRQQRPRFHESGSWADRDDEDLENELREYKNYLTGNL